MIHKLDINILKSGLDKLKRKNIGMAKKQYEVITRLIGLYPYSISYLLKNEMHNIGLCKDGFLIYYTSNQISMPNKFKVYNIVRNKGESNNE